MPSAEIDRLKQLLQGVQRSGQPAAGEARVSSGCGPLDQLLPGCGFSRGSLVEWLDAEPGCGVGLLALATAREAAADGGVLVLIDRDRTFYPPAAAAWGIDLQRLILVRPVSDVDASWALDQALRCSHVAAVVSWPQRLEARAFRRLQLAAETSGGLGLLIRPDAARSEPSWADVRLRVSPVGGSRSWQPAAGRKEECEERFACETPLPLGTPPTIRQEQVTPQEDRRGVVGDASRRGLAGRPVRAGGWRLWVEVLRCRGGWQGREIGLEIDDQTGEIHEALPGDLAASMADAAVAAQPARA